MKQIDDRFFIIDLNSKYELKNLDSDALCCYICEHIEDENFVKPLATQMYHAGIRNANFCGANELHWHLWFDEADLDIIGWDNTKDIESDQITMTSSFDIEEFVEWICINKNYCTTYLFFDDTPLLNIVLDKIQHWRDEDETN